MMYPLNVAAIYVDASTQTKPWVIKHLWFLSETVGIR